MFRTLRKTLVATLIATLTLGQAAPVFADSADTLPDMGTSAGSTLSIAQELQMGDYYVRQLRGSAPLINDPLLVQYINGLGMRLVAHANSVRTPFHFYLARPHQPLLIPRILCRIWAPRRAVRCRLPRSCRWVTTTFASCGAARR